MKRLYLLIFFLLPLIFSCADSRIAQLKPYDEKDTLEKYAFWFLNDGISIESPYKVIGYCCIVGDTLKLNKKFFVYDFEIIKKEDSLFTFQMDTIVFEGILGNNNIIKRQK